MRTENDLSSDYTDAKADLSLRFGAHDFVGFCRVPAHLSHLFSSYIHKIYIYDRDWARTVPCTSISLSGGITMMYIVCFDKLSIYIITKLLYIACKDNISSNSSSYIALQLLIIIIMINNNISNNNNG